MYKKLYRFKKWLTLEDTAKRLSIELEEDVNVSDVLQLAIDEQLRISVNFPHDWKGKICDITTDIEKASKYKEVIGLDGKAFKLYEYDKCSDTEYIKTLPEIYNFEAGIWELKLIGNEKIDLEWALKLAKGINPVDVFNISGFYVVNRNGIVIERQKIISNDEHIKLQKEVRNDMKEQILKSDLIDKEKANAINEINNKPLDNNPLICPCASIDTIDGAFFVIQTEHLNEFLTNLEDEQEPSKLSLDISLYLIAEILRATKSKSKQWKQGTIIDEILLQRQNRNEQINGLEQRTIEEYFSQANKRLKSD